jgi:ABC-type sugar transport system ATPase subunit
VTAREPILAFAGVAKRYGAADVLHDVSLAVAPGDFLVVYGPPASGKTVLMRLLMGLEQPDAGRVLLRGADVTDVPAAERNIGYVPQSFALYPHLSVRDNIAYPLKLAGVPGAESEPVVRRAAEMLNIADLLAKRPDQLSGGQKQRVAIARGIAKRSDLYVLDDPLAGLDFKLREQLVEDLRALQQETRATFLYTTSDAVEALTLADTLAVLDGGRIIESGEPERLYRQPANLRTMALVGFPPSNFLEGMLEPRNGRGGGADVGAWCRTSLFDFPVRLDPDVGAGAGRVTVGLRPEDVAIDADRANGHARDRLLLEARVVLREDLGGEEIVYLDCAGVSLSTVDRHHDHGDDLDRRIVVAVRPDDLVLFRPGSGERLGRGGAAAASRSARGGQA